MAAEAFARRLAGDNGPARVVPYAAEAGQFQEAGFSTVICGPGSIDQAHQPDEYVERTQMERGGAFMARLIDWGVDGLITDYPDRARAVMRDKGMALPAAIQGAKTIN